jgi:hypothetical protein
VKAQIGPYVELSLVASPFPILYLQIPTSLGFTGSDLCVLDSVTARKQDPISKITRVKSAGVVPQAVECLPCNYEALSSNPTTTNNITTTTTNMHCPLFGLFEPCLLHEQLSV